MTDKPVTASIPVQDATPVTGNPEVQGTQVGRTGGAHPPTGASLMQRQPSGKLCMVACPPEVCDCGVSNGGI